MVNNEMYFDFVKHFLRTENYIVFIVQCFISNEPLIGEMCLKATNESKTIERIFKIQVHIVTSHAATNRTSQYIYKTMESNYGLRFPMHIFRCEILKTENHILLQCANEMPE